MKPIQYPPQTDNAVLNAFLREVWQRLSSVQKLEDLELTATLEETIEQVNKIKNMEG
jgi:hypothetical protein